MLKKSWIIRSFLSHSLWPLTFRSLHQKDSSCLEGSHSRFPLSEQDSSRVPCGPGPSCTSVHSRKIQCRAGNCHLVPRGAGAGNTPNHHWGVCLRYFPGHFPNPETCRFMEVSLKISVTYSNDYKGLVGPISLGHDLSLWENSAHTNHGWNKEVFLFMCPAFPFFFWVVYQSLQDYPSCLLLASNVNRS